MLGIYRSHLDNRIRQLHRAAAPAPYTTPDLRVEAHETKPFPHRYSHTLYVIYRSHIDNTYMRVYIYIYIFIYKYIYYTYTSHILTTGCGNYTARLLTRRATQHAPRKT